LPVRYIPATEITPIGPSSFLKKSLVSSFTSNSMPKLEHWFLLTISFWVVKHEWVGFRLKVALNYIFATFWCFARLHLCDYF